jgi:SAM-dependent methyltransferase
MLDTREEIIFLMRGFFALPIIAKLGKAGVIKQILNGEFRLQDIDNIENPEMFRYVVSYLIQVGLLKTSSKNKDYYIATQLGEKILSRYGSFILLHSYHTFMDEFDSMLFDKNHVIPCCDRLDNVIGSGLTNGRKFFPKALKMLEGVNIGTIVDIGCGDGYFLSNIINSFNSANIVAVDLSEIALDKTVENLNSLERVGDICPIKSDAFNVEFWSSAIQKHYSELNNEVIISVWYVVHELSQGSVDRVVEFFNAIYKYLPSAQLIIGEIVRIDDRLLSYNRSVSLMPEFQFFHDVSKQGILTWGEYQEVLEKIPYEVSNIEIFDPILDHDKVIPTSFIWHLAPIKEKR